MADIELYHDVSCPGARSRVRFRGSKRSTARIELWLHLVFGSDMRVTVRLNYCIAERKTWHRYPC